MKTLIIAPENRDYSLELDSWIDRYSQLREGEIERIDPETPAGAQMVKTYDLPEWPAILRVTDDGIEIYRHAGFPLPDPMGLE